MYDRICHQRLECAERKTVVEFESWRHCQGYCGGIQTGKGRGRRGQAVVAGYEYWRNARGGHSDTKRGIH